MLILVLCLFSFVDSLNGEVTWVSAALGDSLGFLSSDDQCVIYFCCCAKILYFLAMFFRCTVEIFISLLRVFINLLCSAASSGVNVPVTLLSLTSPQHASLDGCLDDCRFSYRYGSRNQILSASRKGGAHTMIPSQN